MLMKSIIRSILLVTMTVLLLLFTIFLCDLAADIELQGNLLGISISNGSFANTVRGTITYGSVIDQCHLHHGLEPAVLDTVWLVTSLYLLHKVLVEPPRLFRVRRAVEVGFRALCRFGQQSKLRYYPHMLAFHTGGGLCYPTTQHLAANIRHILLPL